jgi:FHA domain
MRWAAAAGVAVCWLLLLDVTGSVIAATMLLAFLAGLGVVGVMVLRALGVSRDHPWVRQLAARPWRDGQEVLQLALRHLSEVFVVTPSRSLLAPNVVELRMNPDDLHSLTERMDLGLIAESAAEVYQEQVAAHGACFAGTGPAEVRVIPDPSVPAGRYRLRQGHPVDHGAQPAFPFAYAGAQHPGLPYPDAPYPAALRYPGAEPALQYPGAEPAPQYPGAEPAPQYPGAEPAPQYPGAEPAPQYPGAEPAPQYPAAAHPAAPQHPGAQYPDALQPGTPHPGTPHPGAQHPAEHPAAPYPAGAYPVVSDQAAPPAGARLHAVELTDPGPGTGHDGPYRAPDNPYPGFVGHDGNTRSQSAPGRSAGAGMATVIELSRSPVPALRLVTGGSVAETRVSGARAGRGTVELTLPDVPTVSREHARFTFSDGRWWIANLGRNGLTLNGTALVGEQPLDSGDSIRWGMRSDALLSRVEIG